MGLVGHFAQPRQPYWFLAEFCGRRCACFMAEGSGSIFSHSRDVDVDAQVGTQRNTIFFVIVRRRCPFLYSPYHETIRSDRDQFYTAYRISYIHYFL